MADVETAGVGNGIGTEGPGTGSPPPVTVQAEGLENHVKDVVLEVAQGQGQTSKVTITDEVKSETEDQNRYRKKSSVLAMFRDIRVELDARHDKNERIVRLSRDITIESKRIIFLLQRIATDPNVIEEAEDRFQNLRDKIIKDLANELENEDIYYFLRAFSPGLQEYVEGLALLHFLKTGTLIGHEEVQSALFFEVTVSFDGDNESDRDRQRHNFSSGHGYGHGHGRGGRYRGGRGRNFHSGGAGGSRQPQQRSTSNDGQEVPENGTQTSGSDAADGSEPEVKIEEKPASPPPPPPKKVIHVVFPMGDFVLGLCDLTGELMRGCVSAVGSGDFDFATRTCHIVQRIYQGLVQLHPINRKDLRSKMDAIHASVLKMERSCFQLRLREADTGSGFKTNGNDLPDKHLEKDTNADSGLD